MKIKNIILFILLIIGVICIYGGVIYGAFLIHPVLGIITVGIVIVMTVKAISEL